MRNTSAVPLERSKPPSTCPASSCDLMAFEREEEFGPGFVAVARLIAHHRDHRAELMRQADSIGPR